MKELRVGVKVEGGTNGRREELGGGGTKGRRKELIGRN